MHALNITMNQVFSITQLLVSIFTSSSQQCYKQSHISTLRYTSNSRIKNHYIVKMVKEVEPCGGLEWRINMPDGTSKVLVPRCSTGSKIWGKLKGIVRGYALKIWSFLQRAWELGVKEPKKPMHCVKVGMALCFVSLFYYMRPLYDRVGGNAMWAVMTVVVAFEYTVGATLSKCVNRATGTLLAGALGVGVHWIANQSGEKLEPVILQVSVFLLATAATFSRFIPSIKARFDYGAMIFILTFSLVSVSSYRVEKLFELAHHRLSTIGIGTSICILISMLFSPVWAGTELHDLINSHMEKLADSLDGYVADYFGDNSSTNSSNNEAPDKICLGYKCVLNSKATEESLANFAIWEPAHGGFNFRHPWKEYLKVGASLRSCAYCIEALNSSISSKSKAPVLFNKHFSKLCIKLSSEASAVLKELAANINTMVLPSKTDVMVEGMRNTVKELQNALNSFSKQSVVSTEQKTEDSVNGAAGNASPAVVTLAEIMPLVTISSLLIEVAARTEKIAKVVHGLADKAHFRVESAEKMKRQNQKILNHIIANDKEVTTMNPTQKY